MHVAVLGSSGLVGQALVSQLLRDPEIDQVKIIVRKPARVNHSKLVSVLLDFSDQASLEDALADAEIIFCCIGTTMKQVHGDKKLYRSIDYDIPVAAATFGSRHETKKFVLVSAIGADEKSGNFYLRLKGEVEDAISNIPFEAVHIFRPSFLLGKRKEQRAGEGIAKSLFSGIGWLLIGGLKKFHPVHDSQVAEAMIAAAKSDRKGVHYYDYKKMLEIISNPRRG